MAKVDKPKTVLKKKKAKPKNIGLGILNVNASFNNTLVSVTDKNGNTLTWYSSGAEGFSGSKKSTPFAAAKVMTVIVERMKNLGITQTEVNVRGVGSGRDSVLRVLGSSGIDIICITDKTPVPHNGCRPSKERRG